jgi:dihydroorotate dehydrogenase (fumarate)
LINKYKDTVQYVVAINTIGNSLAVDVESESPPLSSNNGYAGLSGPAVKYTALANVRQLRQHLDPAIDVVGVGGIVTGEDAFAMLLCGAKAVQIGTTHWTEGPKCFDRILGELTDIMTSKGYTNLNEVIGKLKPWSKEGAALSRAAAKKAKQDTSTTSVRQGKSSSSTSINPVSIINCILVVIIAILLADKYGLLNLPE